MGSLTFLLQYSPEVSPPSGVGSPTANNDQDNFPIHLAANQSSGQCLNWVFLFSGVCRLYQLDKTQKHKHPNILHHYSIRIIILLTRNIYETILYLRISIWYIYIYINFHGNILYISYLYLHWHIKWVLLFLPSI